MFLADFIAEKPFLKIFPLISFEHGTLAAKFYDPWKEVSYSKNKNSSEISEQNGTTCRYVQCKIQKFIKIRIPLLSRHWILPIVREVWLNAQTGERHFGSNIKRSRSWRWNWAVWHSTCSSRCLHPSVCRYSSATWYVGWSKASFSFSIRFEAVCKQSRSLFDLWLGCSLKIP